MRAGFWLGDVGVSANGALEIGGQYSATTDVATLPMQASNALHWLDSYDSAHAVRALGIDDGHFFDRGNRSSLRDLEQAEPTAVEVDNGALVAEIRATAARCALSSTIRELADAEAEMVLRLSVPWIIGTLTLAGAVLRVRRFELPKS